MTGGEAISTDEKQLSLEPISRNRLHKPKKKNQETPRTKRREEAKSVASDETEEEKQSRLKGAATERLLTRKKK